jgi:transposase
MCASFVVVFHVRQQWKALPKDLPPKSTVHDYLELWNWDGTLERIHHTLYVAVREQEGREASPTVARARRSKAASGTSWSTCWVTPANKPGSLRARVTVGFMLLTLFATGTR